jgi:hypothetical protein
MDVLVYLDPSPRGEWALAAAAQLPPRWKGRLRLVATEEDAAAEASLLDRARARLAGCGPVETLTRPELSIACVRYVPEGGATDPGGLDALNARIHRRLVRETPYLPSTTVVAGAFAIRPCFINPRTTWELVREFVVALVRLGDEEAAHDITGP